MLTKNGGSEMLQDNTQKMLRDLFQMREGLRFEELEERLGLAYRASTGLHRVVAFYLQELQERRLFQLAGCRSAVQYAVSRHGMSRREARDLLRVGQALQDLPAIDEAFANAELCWSKVRDLVKVASREHEAKWLEKARELSIEELALEIKLAKPGEAPRARDDRKGLPELRLKLTTSLPVDVFAKWERVKQKLQEQPERQLQEWECFEALCDLGLALEDDAEHVSDSKYVVIVHASSENGVATVETEDGPVPISETIAEMIACDAPQIDATVPVTVAGEQSAKNPLTRMISGPLRKMVMVRDGFRCRACRSRQRLQMHHVVFHSLGGATSIDNLAVMCRSCHSLIHGGLLTIQGQKSEDWRFVDRAGKDIHERAGSLDRLARDAFGRPRRIALPLASEPCLRLADLPSVLEQSWWRRHAELIRWNESQAAFELCPGMPLREHPEARASEPAELHLQRSQRKSSVRGRFAEIIGQERVVAELEVAVRAAMQTGEPVGHILLSGSPGLGKTTLARAIASERGVQLHTISGPVLKNPTALVRLLAGIRENDIVFIDETHAIAQSVAEVLYEALEDQRLSLLMMAGAELRTISLRLAPFTLIAATTEAGSLPDALMSRFTYHEHLEFYNPDELCRILARAAVRERLDIDAEAIRCLAEASRATPREALRLLQRLRNAALVQHVQTIDLAFVESFLERLGIDAWGLGQVDRDYLAVLRNQGARRPLGISRVASMLAVPVKTLERFHEPYLFRLGLATTTPSGRIALPRPGVVPLCADQVRG